MMCYQDESKLPRTFWSSLLGHSAELFELVQRLFSSLRVILVSRRVAYKNPELQSSHAQVPYLPQVIMLPLALLDEIRKLRGEQLSRHIGQSSPGNGPYMHI